MASCHSVPLSDCVSQLVADDVLVHWLACCVSGCSRVISLTTFKNHKGTEKIEGWGKRKMEQKKIHKARATHKCLISSAVRFTLVPGAFSISLPLQIVTPQCRPCWILSSVTMSGFLLGGCNFSYCGASE